jgi:hypothetical protein
MAARKYNNRKAFTLVEVLVTAMAAVILIVGLSAMLFYGQRGYNTMFRRINSEVVRNAYETRRVFDAVVRKSTVERCDIRSIVGINDKIYLYYYYDETAPAAPAVPDFQYPNVDRYGYMFPAQPDRFAIFYLQGTNLMLEQGEIFPQGAPLFSIIPESLDGTGTTNMLLAQNVVSCQFRNTGEGSIQMILTLDDETSPESNVYSETQTLKMVVTSRAIRHNKIID